MHRRLVTATLVVMSISVTDPIGRAWNRMVEMLFKPFDLSKWFALGFCVFLANLGRGGGSYQYRNGPTNINWGSVFEWVRDNIYLVIAWGLAVFFLMTLFRVLVLWLRSRGVFMMIDGLANNRALVKDPWRCYRAAGHSLFGFSLIMFLGLTLVMLLTLGAAGLIARPDIANETFGTPAILAIILMVVVIPLVTVNYAIAEMLLIDFIAPTMYIHGLRVMPAWKLWYREVFKGNFWRLTLFYLMKMVLGFAVGVAAMLAFCLTCCLVLVPYLGTVILLPALVFMRCYTLYFLEQFGESWRLFVYDTGSILCVSCGYDLRGNPGALTCPECGGATPVSVDQL